VLLLVSGCKTMDQTKLWKLNRGEDYMNGDQYFSVPVRATPSPAIAPVFPSHE
jgi:hypothetical protein